MAIRSMHLNAQHVEHGPATSSIVPCVTASTGERRPSLRAVRTVRGRSSGVDALDLLKHGLGQLLLHWVELPVGSFWPLRPHVQRQQPTGEDVL